MKAIRFPGNCRAEVFEAPMPEAPPGYALIKVRRCGICGTDIELWFSDSKPLPCIPGHEIAGEIVSLGGSGGVGGVGGGSGSGGSGGFEVGQRVLVNLHITCNECDHCKAGNSIFCKELRCLGSDLDGGAAEYVAVPFEHGNLLPIPDDVSYTEALLVTDALSTGYTAAKVAVEGMREGEKLAVVGVGPVGMMCVLCASRFGADVMAIDPNGARREMALKFGSLSAADPFDEGFSDKTESFTNGKGFDVTIDASGKAAGILLALRRLLRPKGKHVQVGVCPEVTFNMYDDCIMKDLTIIGSRGYNSHELPEVIEFARTLPKGLLESLISHKFELDEAQEAYDTVRGGKGMKVVFCPNG